MPGNTTALRLFPGPPRAAWPLAVRWLRAAALAALTTAAGCALLAPPPQVSGKPFDIVGRVAVNFDGRSFTSNLRWRHVGSGGEVWLMTPLGQTLAHIQTDGEGATLTAADRQQYRAASVEALTLQALGWELPLSRLTWWLRGEPVPDAGAAVARRDERLRLTALEQDGWRIDYVNYPPDQHGGLPRRLDLHSGGQVIRLLIDGWRDVGSAR